MSLDRSLKSASSLVRHRNVLTRAERLTRLQEGEKWNDTKPVFGLPKVANRKAAVVKAEKAEAAPGTEGAVAAGTAPAAGAAAPAAGTKGAAPAAGAKGGAGAKAAAPAAAAGKAAAPAKKK